MPSVAVSAIPAKLNLTAWRGATFRKSITYYNGPDTSSPVVDLTGVTARMDIRDPITSSLLYSLTSGSGGIALGGTDGTIALTITDDTTATFAWNAGIYELFLTFIDGSVDVVVYGGFGVRGF